jgi:hypothetical protein
VLFGGFVFVWGVGCGCVCFSLVEGVGLSGGFVVFVRFGGWVFGLCGLVHFHFRD